VGKKLAKKKKISSQEEVLSLNKTVEVLELYLFRKF